MAVDKVPMTIEGFEALKAELQRLKAVERPRIIQAISEARNTAIFPRTPNIMPPRKPRA